MSRGGVRRLVSSDDEPLVSAARNVVARVCTTQIDDESSRMIPSTVPAMPVSLAWVMGERAPCPSDVIDALEDDLATHWVQGIEGRQRDSPSVVQGSIPVSALDRHDACRRGRRWRGPPEASRG